MNWGVIKWQISMYFTLGATFTSTSSVCFIAAHNSSPFVAHCRIFFCCAFCLSHNFFRLQLLLLLLLFSLRLNLYTMFNPAQFKKQQTRNTSQCWRQEINFGLQHSEIWPEWMKYFSTAAPVFSGSIHFQMRAGSRISTIPNTRN